VKPDPKAREKAIEAAAKLKDSILADPAKMAYEFWKFKCWSRQEEMLVAPFRKETRISVWPTGHKVGKTAVVPIQIIFWLLTHYPAYVLVTSAAWSNVEEKIFPGLKTLVEELYRGKYKGLFDPRKPVLTNKWILHPEWQCLGLSPDHGEVFRGYHSKGIGGGTFWIVDEGSKLLREIDDELIAYQGDTRNSGVYYGNPTQVSGPFAKMITTSVPGVYVSSISSLETPNCVSGKIIIPGLADRAYVQGVIDKYGIESVQYMSRVLGVLPAQSDKTYIPMTVIQACGERECPPPGQGAGKMGVDPARSEKGDCSVIVIRDQKSLFHHESHRGWTMPEMRTRILELIKQFPFITEVIIDRTGVGSGLADSLELDSKEMEDVMILGIYPGQRAHHAKQCMNARAECWMNMKVGLETLAIPRKYLDTFREVARMERSATQDSRLAMERKELYKEREGHSPNDSDALSYTYYQPVGDSLFSEFKEKKSAIRMSVKPVIQKHGDDWIIGLGEGMAGARRGVLYRSLWYSRRGKSAAIWVHLDTDGCWCVWNALTWERTPIRDIARDMFGAGFDEKGNRFEFDLDVCCANESEYRMLGNAAYHDELDMEFDALSRNRGLRSQSPLPMAPHQLKGAAGLDVLDDLIANTPSNERMICVWPKPVLQELQYARLRESGSRVDDDADKPEAPLAGGGAFTRALRMLALESVGVAA